MTLKVGNTSCVRHNSIVDMNDSTDAVIVSVTLYRETIQSQQIAGIQSDRMRY